MVGTASVAAMSAHFTWSRPALVPIPADTREGWGGRRGRGNGGWLRTRFALGAEHESVRASWVWKSDLFEFGLRLYFEVWYCVFTLLALNRMATLP